MKKNFILAIIINAAINNSVNAAQCHASACSVPYTLTSSCQALQNSCSSTTSGPNAYHIITKTTAELSWGLCPSTSGGTRTCTLINKKSYSCEKGYYGSPINSMTGCTKCPDGGTTAASGATLIRQCYLPSGTTGEDDKGYYTHTADCYHSLQIQL